MNKQKKWTSVIVALLLLAGLVMTVFGILLVYSGWDFLQYIQSVDSSEDGLYTQYGRFEDVRKELSSLTGGNSISVRSWNVPIGTDNGESFVTVYGTDKYYFGLYHETLIEGRMPSDRDIREARKVIVIDQELAYHLFPAADAIGHNLRMGKTEWTVVGLVQTVPRFGEANHTVVFVPITTLFNGVLEPQTMEIHLRRDRNTPTAVLKNEIIDKIGEGTWIDLAVKKVSAMMPIRLIMVILLGYLICVVLKKMACYLKKQYLVYRELLQEKYARQLIGWLIGRLFILLLGCVAVSSFIMAAVYLIRQVIFIFPEWIPEKPFSLPSYISRFWSINQAESVGIVYQSRGQSMIKLSSWLIRMGCMCLTGWWFIHTTHCANKN